MTTMKPFGGAFATLLFASSVARAGPPYITDDPEPVEYRHWEVYLASQSFEDGSGWTGTAPHVEANYGVAHDVQLHVITPLAYAAPNAGPVTFGYGDTELGVKFRFVHETKSVPMIGSFPLVEAPTGDASRGLGNGSTLVFVPVWIQKSFGKWLTYGGAGVWIDLGDRDRHWWYFGLHAEYRAFKWLSVGVEVFDVTPTHHGESNDARFDLGAVIDFSDVHHLMMSAGRSFVGPILFQSYVAYQVTFGPK